MHCSNAFLFWYLFAAVVVFVCLFVCFVFFGGGGEGYCSVPLSFRAYHFIIYRFSHG